MNSKSQPLPRSAFAAFCALALVASMALPFMGASKSYAEEAEAPAAEDAQAEPAQVEEKADEAIASDDGTQEQRNSTSEDAETCQVAIIGVGTQQVKKGEKIEKPADLPDQIVEDGDWAGKTAHFLAWKKADDPASPGAYVTYAGKPYIDESFFDFSTPITEDTVLIPAYYITSYSVHMSLTLPGGASRGRGSSVLEGDTIFSTTAFASEGEWRKEIYDNPLKALKGGGEDLAEAGYTFDGVWYYEGTDKVFDPSVPITENISIVAYAQGGPARPEGQTYSLGSSPTGSTTIQWVGAEGLFDGPNTPKGANVQLSSSVVAAGDDYIALKGQLGDSIFGEIIQIDLMANGKWIHDGFGDLTLKFMVGSDYDGHTFTVYHRHQDGHITSETAVAEDGIVAITVTDLSSFALVEGGKAGADAGADSEGEVKPLGGSALAQTGDTTPILAFGGFALAALGAVAFAGYRTRKTARK